MKPRDRAKWFNAIADAWNAGEAPWAYVAGQSIAVFVWEQARRISGDDAADQALVNLATSHGLSLRRRRPIQP